MLFWESALNKLFAVVSICVAVLCTTTVAVAAPYPECRIVHGRYRIYANHDRLWIVGSKHFLDVTIDELDRGLEARDWEDTVAYADFTLCTDRKGDPLNLTTHDRIDVTGYSHLTYRRVD